MSSLVSIGGLADNYKGNVSLDILSYIGYSDIGHLYQSMSMLRYWAQSKY